MENRRITEVDEVGVADTAIVTVRDADTGLVIRQFSPDDPPPVNVRTDLQLVNDVISGVRVRDDVVQNELVRIMGGAENNIRFFLYAMARHKMNEAGALADFATTVREQLACQVKEMPTATKDLIRLYGLLQDAENNNLKYAQGLVEDKHAEAISQPLESGEAEVEREVEVTLNVKKRERMRGILTDLERVIKNGDSGTE